MILELRDVIGKNLSEMDSKKFSELVISYLKKGKIKKEVFVFDRGDGRSGRIDFTYELDGKIIAVELDRLSPRKKSIIKLSNFNADESYIITRTPVEVWKLANGELKAQSL